jgi:hypothetical protein
MKVTTGGRDKVSIQLLTHAGRQMKWEMDSNPVTLGQIDQIDQGCRILNFQLL